ncbi:hypothetical protein [Polaribacter ponticola]|uniref:Lipoprotein n=1 Tax=Polaribacter ponticola TaxID=2978475 RepID=A0ABT5SBR4_9FLAO|nr:hypothetical protein [Polaribacter sp. MSW5]MDD7915568.1 hypothetical protein [Polaribacter sp. MSW5]
MISLLILACEKEINYPIETNVIENDNSIIKTQRIESDEKTIVINLDLTYKKSQRKLPTIQHKFISSNSNNVIEDLKNNAKSVNGIYSIEYNNKIIYEMTIKKGEIISKKSHILMQKTVEDCSASGIIECFDSTVEDMNWVEYGFCIATAPTCTARITASCIWEECF